MTARSFFSVYALK